MPWIMLRTRPSSSIKHWPRIGLGLLLAALLWAQILGQVHGVLHAHTSLAVSAQETSALSVPAHGTDVFGHLLSPAGDESKCRLYDQLGHAGPTQHVVVQVSFPPVWWPAWVAQNAFQPSFCAAFAARAPPASL
jgi:hypothetical protein